MHKLVYINIDGSVVCDYLNPKKLLDTIWLLCRVGNNDRPCYYSVLDGTHVFEDSLTHGGIFKYDDWLGLNISSVFIPTTEMLSHAKGFLAMNQKYSMPFDGTQVDIIVNASLPETREIGEYRLDYSKAVWATDRMHRIYHDAKVPLSDADFVIEDTESIMIMEYKKCKRSIKEWNEDSTYGKYPFVKIDGEKFLRY